MKSKIFALTLILAASFNTIFAAEVNNYVLASFKKEFVKAENIKWTVAGPLAKASFIQDGKSMVAYYDENGDRYALATNVALADMPASLMSEIKNSYEQFWITDAFYLTTVNSNGAYYVAIESADKRILLKSHGTKSWIQYKVTVKD